MIINGFIDNFVDELRLIKHEVMITDNLPIGNQSFPLIRKNGLVYVDKTAEMYKLVRCPAA